MKDFVNNHCKYRLCNLILEYNQLNGPYVGCFKKFPNKKKNSNGNGRKCGIVVQLQQEAFSNISKMIGDFRKKNLRLLDVVTVAGCSRG